MPTRREKRSAHDDAEWQLDILRASLEVKTITPESVMNAMWLLLIFSVGGIGSTVLSGSGTFTSTGLTFIALLCVSAAGAYGTLWAAGKSRAEFRSALMQLSRRKPLPQAEFEKLLNKSDS